MSTTYGGDGSQPSSRPGYAKIAITAIGNTSPITITTGSTHSYVTGDTVQIDGATISSANITANIVVTSTNQFTLTGTLAAGAGTAGGYVQNYEVAPFLTIPSDGDLRNAASVNVPIEGAVDKVPWLYQRVGALRCFGIYNFQVSDDTFSAWQTFTQQSISVVWRNFNTFTSWPSNTPQPVVRNGDVIEVEFQSTVKTGTSSNLLPLALGIILTPSSGTVPAFARIPGSAAQYPSNTTIRCHLRAHYVCGPSDDERKLDMCLLVQDGSSPGINVSFLGDRQMIIRHWRVNT